MNDRFFFSHGLFENVKKERLLSIGTCYMITGFQFSCVKKIKISSFIAFSTILLNIKISRYLKKSRIPRHIQVECKPSFFTYNISFIK